MASTRNDTTPGQAIKALPTGKFIRLAKVKPAGALEARKLASGATTFYWRVTLAGKNHREVIGTYDPLASPKSLEPTNRGYSVEAAIRAAEALASQHEKNKEAGGILAVRAAEKAAKAEALAAQQRAEAAALAEQERIKAERERAERYTLARLLDDYCDHLQAIGRGAHKDARSIFRLHVIEAWPEVAALPAAEVDSEQVTNMMRRLVDVGKDRTANKLRSYVRAAYEVARKVRTKATIPAHFKGYGVRHNPAEETSADEAANRDDKNPWARQSCAPTGTPSRACRAGAAPSCGYTW